MIPPNKTHLQALAGWAISARGNCSNEQHMALCHFQDGCGELAEVIEDIAPAAQPVPQVPSPARHVEESVRVPLEIAQLEHVQKEGTPCSHRFDIRTQLCRYCGLTYRKAMGRKPELF